MERKERKQEKKERKSRKKEREKQEKNRHEKGKGDSRHWCREYFSLVFSLFSLQHMFTLVLVAQCNAGCDALTGTLLLVNMPGDESVFV